MGARGPMDCAVAFAGDSGGSGTGEAAAPGRRAGPSPPPAGGSSRPTRVLGHRGTSRLSPARPPLSWEVGFRRVAVGGPEAAEGRGAEESERAGGQEGAGGSAGAGRKTGTHQEPRHRGPADPPAMWGLLLAVTAFAPSVGLSLGAPSASVLGLAPGSTLAPHSSLTQPSTKANGELWDPRSVGC